MTLRGLAVQRLAPGARALRERSRVPASGRFLEADRWRRYGRGIRICLPPLLLLALLSVPAFGGEALTWEIAAPEATRHYNAAVRLLNNQRPEDAEERLRKSLEVEDTGMARVLLAETRLRQGDTVEAVALLQEVTERSAPRADVQSRLARALLVREDLLGAASAAEAAVVTDPDSVLAWESLALVRGRAGEDERLLEELTAERQRANRPVLGCFEAMADARLGREAAGRALLDECARAEQPSLLHNARTLLDGSSQSAYERAAEALRAERWAQAARLATRALEEGTPRPLAGLVRAVARWRSGDPEGARDDVLAALGDRGSWVAVVNDGALVGTLTRGQEDELRRRVEESAWMLVRLELALGRPDAARSALERAREAFGEGPGERVVAVALLHATGESGRAWAVLAEGLASDDPPGPLADAAGHLAYEAASLAPADLVARIRDLGPAELRLPLAAGLHNASRWAECEAVASVLLDAPEPVPDAGVLAYTCAVAGDDLGAATAHGEELGWSGLGRPAVRAHVEALVRRGELEGAVSVLEASRADSWPGDEGAWAREQAKRLRQGKR